MRVGVCWRWRGRKCVRGDSLRLRVKDVCLERCQLIVRDAKGGKDRVTVLPGTILHALRVHLQELRIRFEQQRAAGAPGVSLPTALLRKYPNASTQWGWQYVFPADSYCEDVYSGRPTFAPPCSTRTSLERA